MTIGKRFRFVSVAAFGLVVTLAVVIGFTLINQYSLNRAQSVRYESYQRANELRMSSEDLTRLARTYVVTGDSKYEDEYWKILDVRNGKKPRADGRTVSLRKLMEDLGFTNEEFAKLKEAENNSNGLVTTETIAMNAVKGLYDDGNGNYTKHAAPNPEMARKIMHDDKYHQDKEHIMKPIGEFETLLNQRTETAVASYVLRGNILLGLIATLALSIAASLFYIVASSKTVLRDIVEQMQKTANKAVDLSRVMLETSQVVSNVSTEQASGVQETVAALNEINAIASHTAENVQKSTEITQSSKQLAEQGKESVQKMTTAIQEIHESNNSIFTQVTEGNKQLTEIVQIISQISEKTKVINDIVFQTKLLSFNASVEAARAGEHGKGFSVVAEEVGNLAKMSGMSAHEISTMLHESIEKVGSIVKQTSSQIEALVGEAGQKVERGTNIARACHDSLSEVVVTVSNVNEMMREISSASGEQAKGVLEITTAMSSLDQSTQKNSQSANKSAEISRELETSMRSLLSQVLSIEKDMLGLNSTQT